LTFRKVENAGHFLMREKPELVNEAITEFVIGDRKETRS
jgi:pimeloyl-ACP methyl ester carboxylesterase